MEFVADLAINVDWEVRKEAIWVLSIIVAGGTSTQIITVVEFGSIDAFCSILDMNDTELSIALAATHKILKIGAANGKDYVRILNECGGLLHITELWTKPKRSTNAPSRLTAKKIELKRELK